MNGIIKEVNDLSRVKGSIALRNARIKDALDWFYYIKNDLEKRFHTKILDTFNRISSKKDQK